MEIQRTRAYKIPFSQLEMNPENAREVYEGIKELAQSLRENGAVKQIDVYKNVATGKYITVDGNRRFRAAEMVFNEDGTDIVFSAKILEKPTKENILLIQLHSDDRRNFKPLEYAGLLKRFVAEGWDAESLAVKSGQSIIHVRNLLRLLEAPAEALGMIRKNIVSATTIIDLQKKGTLTQWLESGNFSKKSLPGEEVASEEVATEPGPESKPNGNKQAQITARKIGGLNSVKEFKRFSKQFHEEFPNDKVRAAYYFAHDLLHNNLSYDEILNYFTDGKTDTDPKQQTGSEKKTKYKDQKLPGLES